MTSDYSTHLVEAKKALATAEAQAALLNWIGARDALAQVEILCNKARISMLRSEESGYRR